MHILTQKARINVRSNSSYKSQEGAHNQARESYTQMGQRHVRVLLQSWALSVFFHLFNNKK